MLFTHQERKIVLFLIGIAILGMGIDFLIKGFAPVKAVICMNEDISRLDLNKADKRMLMSIPGIGETLAERILEYRLKMRGFSSKEELMNIRGISGNKYNKIKEMVCVN